MAKRETPTGTDEPGTRPRSASGRAASGGRQRKDRLIQTRVPRDLESTLKAEAKRRRLSVSHLIRNVLEDTFQLVDGVVADVDQIVTDSVSLARQVGRNARKLAAAAQVTERRASKAEARETTPESSAAPDGDQLQGHDHVYAWNEVVLHKPTACASCGEIIERGAPGFVGLTDHPELGRPWLCPDCVAAL